MAPLSLRLLIVATLIALPRTALRAETVKPSLAFPQAGVDDPRAYEHRLIRFLLDSSGNVFEIVLDGQSGRIRNTWVNGLGESFGFSIRDSEDKAVPMSWTGDPERGTRSSGARWIRYAIALKGSSFDVGHVLIDSVLREHDASENRQDLDPFDPTKRLAHLGDKEFSEMLAALRALPAAQRAEQLRALHAASVDELTQRTAENVSEPEDRNGRSDVRIERQTLDGKYDQRLELSVDDDRCALRKDGSVLRLHRKAQSPCVLDVRLETNAPTIGRSLRREQIFRAAYLDSLKRQDDPRIERDLRSMELLSTPDRLLVGLPNYGTFFGRDTLTTALMMESLWTPQMVENVLGAALARTSKAGRVSHEERLGYAAYWHHLPSYTEALRRGRFDEAKSLAASLDKPFEYDPMIDADFEIPVLLDRLLRRPDVSETEKRRFVSARLQAISANLSLIAGETRPYVEHPDASHLIHFPPPDEGGWNTTDWRDSHVGYADGSYPMDVNALWAPRALSSAARLVSALRGWGLRAKALDDPQLSAPALERAADAWNTALRHFQADVPAKEARERLSARLAALDPAERDYWSARIAGRPIDEARFTALSLDESAKPIPVLTSDLSTMFFLDDFTGLILERKMDPKDVLGLLAPALTDYPLGLFIDGVGVLASNEVYAEPKLWKEYGADAYHGPRVVWGREVNLLMLGLSKQIVAAYDKDGRLRDPRLKSYVEALQAALEKIHAAVEASSLWHNELWTYRIREGRLSAVRYRGTSDIQLWNLSALAVEDSLAKTRALTGGRRPQ